MNPTKLLEMAEQILKHAAEYKATGDLKSLTKAQVRARNFMAAAYTVEEERRKK